MDNFYHNCPPKMEDQGRHLGDFQTATRRNEYIKYINDIHRDDQYRLFLQSNGTDLLDNMWGYQRNYNSCPLIDCVHHYPLRTNPRQFVQEREAYDSITDMNTNARLTPMRQCPQRGDYRLNPIDPPIAIMDSVYADVNAKRPTFYDDKPVSEKGCRTCLGGYKQNQ